MHLENWERLSLKDESIKAAMDALDETTFQDSFYKSLEFGTAGMRGLLGVGPNRMNIYTVAKASLGFGKYLVESFKGQEMKIAIAYDNRHMSLEFAQVSAAVLARLGISSYVFKHPRPTPQLSFAVADMNCIGGIVITASHNPKEYNGFKVYDETGCQLVDHKIKRVIELIQEHPDETTVEFDLEDTDLLHWIDTDYDEVYKDAVATVQLRPEANKTVKIVFSSQHGTAYPIMNDLFEACGYDVVVVKEQSSYDPDFTNTKTPNPEDKASFDLAIKYAKKTNADIILSCDPDADRMGIVVLQGNDYVYLTGNQGGSILQEYLYSSLIETGKMPESPMMYNTVVTSDLGEKIAHHYGVSVEKTLTGFKYIGEKIQKAKLAGSSNFVFGYEESYGYLLKDFVRDKDAIQACLMLAEAANYYKAQDLTLVDVLESLYTRFGAHHEETKAYAFVGEQGLQKIQDILKTFRDSVLEEIAGIPVAYFDDFLSSKRSTGEVLDFPSSNVLKYVLSDGSWIAIRPSGTEPKLKIYYCVVSDTMANAQTKFSAIHKEIETIAEI